MNGEQGGKEWNMERSNNHEWMVFWKATWEPGAVNLGGREEERDIIKMYCMKTFNKFLKELENDNNNNKITQWVYPGPKSTHFSEPLYNQNSHFRAVELLTHRHSRAVAPRIGLLIFFVFSKMMFLCTYLSIHTNTEKEKKIQQLNVKNNQPPYDPYTLWLSCDTYVKTEDRRLNSKQKWNYKICRKMDELRMYRIKWSHPVSK